MSSPIIKTRRALLATAMLAAGPAFAGFDLYASDEGKITFNFDAVAAVFANKDSWFGESRSFLGDNTDHWSEYGIEPRLTYEWKVGSGTLFGQLSAVHTQTGGDDASGLTIDNGDNSSTNTEQANIGWKTTDPLESLKGYEFSVSVGRQDYKIGSGMLIADGGSDGGDFGGWYIGSRKAHQESALIQLKNDKLLAETFRLKNRPRSGGIQGEAYGANVEYTFWGTTKLGGTYMKVDANEDGFDQLDVWDGRLDWTPDGVLSGVGVSGEFAHQDSDEFNADGWFAQGSYQFQKAPWTPSLIYRYAHFDGDNPDTTRNEGWRNLAYGFTDYGSWYQGEISGNYPLSNTSLNSNLYRIKAQPNDKITLNLMYYDFWFDDPSVLGTGVTSDDWGKELNFTIDWAVTEQFYVIGVLGNLSPGKAAEQWTGGDNDWRYSMLYVSYSY
jgi:hypothetical protein